MDKRIFVITGAAGTGKTTVRNYLCDHFKMTRVITHTTRPPRNGEVDGKDYYFESNQSFAKRHFLESVLYDHYHYGSSYEGINDAFKRSSYICIVLDTSGAYTYLKKMPKLVTLIYLTVNHHSLKRRMMIRGDSLDRIQRRLRSQENNRDQMLPTKLQNKAIIIDNDNWMRTREILNQLMKEKLNSFK